MKETCLIFFDLETSGLDLSKHEILEIAWVITDMQLKELCRSSHLVLPEHLDTADPKALKINGFNSERWEKSGVALKTVLFELSNLIPKGERAIPAGHNIASFDVPFLRKEFKECNIFCPLSFYLIDTYTMSIAYSIASRQKLPNFKLATVAKHFGIEFQGDAHTAMADVVVSYKIFKEIAGLMRIGYDECNKEDVSDSSSGKCNDRCDHYKGSNRCDLIEGPPIIGEKCSWAPPSPAGDNGKGLLPPPESWELIPTNKICSVCKYPQFDSPGGLVCKNGHGGAASLEDEFILKGQTLPF